MGPHIILLPKSVLGNWQLEFKRFCPSVRVLRLSGTKVTPRCQPASISFYTPVDDLLLVANGVCLDYSTSFFYSLALFDGAV